MTRRRRQDGAPIVLVGESSDERARLEGKLRAEGFVVVAVVTAGECVAFVRETSPALVIVDQDLADRDGWELVRVLRTLLATEKTPIVGVAANESRVNVERSLLVGCDAFLAKPCDVPALLERVEQLLERAAARR